MAGSSNNEKELPIEATDENKVISWNFCEPEPEIFKGFLNIRKMAAEKIKTDYAKELQEYEEKAKDLLNTLEETKVLRDKVKNFLETKSYLFTTPVEELPSHPSFLRDFGTQEEESEKEDDEGKRKRRHD